MVGILLLGVASGGMMCGVVAAPPSSEASWDVSVADYRELAMGAFADRMVELLNTQPSLARRGLPSEVVDHAWHSYLGDRRVLASASAPELFKLLTAVVTELSADRRAEFSQLYREVLREKGEGAELRELVILGWSKVFSGLANEGEDDEWFNELVWVRLAGEGAIDAAMESLQSSPKIDDASWRIRLSRLQSEGSINPQDSLVSGRSLRRGGRRADPDRAQGSWGDPSPWLISGAPVLRRYAAALMLSSGMVSAQARERFTDRALERPVVEALEVLSWAYHRVSELAPWLVVVERRAEDGNLSGDARANWLMTRGYLEEIRLGRPRPGNGELWRLQAMGVAESEAVVLFAVESIVRRQLAAGAFDQAQSMLQSMEAQFSQEAQPDLALLVQEVHAARGREERRREIEQLRSELSSLRSDNRRIRARLSGDSRGFLTEVMREDYHEAIARNEQRIAEIRSQVQSSQPPR